MMLRSNIPQVINRLQRLQAGYPSAVQAAIAPEYWRARLSHVTLKTLRAQWALERNVQTRALYERLTPLIVETLTGFIADGVSVFTLSFPSSLSQQLGIEAASDYNLNRRTPTGRMKKFAIEAPDAERNLAQVRQTIRDWVRIEKHLEPDRDYHKDGTPLSEDELVDRIEHILGVSESAMPSGRTVLMDDAAKKLSGAIQRWVQGEGDNPGVATPATVTVTPEVMTQWLTAVMLAWRDFVRAQLQGRIDLELTKLHRRIQNELI